MRFDLPFAKTIGICAAMLLLPAVSFAASNLDAGDIAANLEETTTSFFSLMITFFAFIGLCLVGFGVWMIYKDQKQPGQEYAKKGIIAAVIGAVLLVLPVFVDVGTNTLTGGQEQGSQNIRLP